MPKKKPARRNFTRTLILCFIGFIWGTLITVFAVPLYSLLCKLTGSALPTIAAVASAPATGNANGRTITIRFSANVASGVPVQLTPLAYTMQVPVGEPVLTAYKAVNPSRHEMDGVAVHMLYAMGGAEEADPSPYVSLQQCFCFEQQHYPAKSDIRLPLSFTISPDLPKDIHSITFAYTLYEALPDDPRIRKKERSTSSTTPNAVL